MIRSDAQTLPHAKVAEDPVTRGDARAISALLFDWLNDPSEYDRTVWPVLEQDLNEDRLEMDRGDAPGV